MRGGAAEQRLLQLQPLSYSSRFSVSQMASSILLAFQPSFLDRACMYVCMMYVSLSTHPPWAPGGFGRCRRRALKDVRILGYQDLARQRKRLLSCCSSCPCLPAYLPATFLGCYLLPRKPESMYMSHAWICGGVSAAAAAHLFSPRPPSKAGSLTNTQMMTMMLD